MTTSNQNFESNEVRNIELFVEINKFYYLTRIVTYWEHTIIPLLEVHVTKDTQMDIT